MQRRFQLAAFPAEARTDRGGWSDGDIITPLPARRRWTIFRLCVASSKKNLALSEI